MPVKQIQSAIEAIVKNHSLLQEDNFISRAEAIDYLDFHIIDRIDGLLQNANPPAELVLLKQQANKTRYELEKIDEALFKRLREEISSGACRGAAFKTMVHKYTGYNASTVNPQGEEGYDNLDIFINGLFPPQVMPAETKEPEAEMVFYQKTPARIIFELAEKISFTDDDVFYDIGSGLGQVCVLVNLISGVRATGIEFEPAYCNYAGHCATTLNLPQVTFINTDARIADYSEGTVFFIYTPFEGSILNDVLEMLRKESLSRTIRLVTYGPCTGRVAQESWLNCESGDGLDVYRLYVFTNRHKVVV